MNIREIALDISRLYTVIRSTVSDAADKIDRLAVENAFMQMRIKEVEDELYGNQGNSVKVPVHKFYTEGLPDTVKADVDLFYGFASIPADLGVSRIYSTEHEEPLALPGAQVSVDPASDKMTIVDKSLDQNDPVKPWIRYHVAASSSNTSEFTSTYTISVPEHSISSKSINAITVVPYPTAAADIVSISTGNSGVYDNLYGWEELRNAGPLKIYTSLIQADSLRVQLKTRYWLERAGLRYFYLGVNHANLEYLTFTRPTAQFFAEVLLPGNGPWTVTSVMPEILNRQFISLPDIDVSFSYYRKGETGLIEYIGSSTPLYVQSGTLIIKCSITIDPQTNVPPQISALIVSC